MMMIDDDDNLTHEPSSEIPQDESQEKSRKPRKKTSKWWNHFIYVGKGSDGKNRVKCNNCGDKLTSDSTTLTTPMKRHYQRCIKKPKYGNVVDMVIDADGKERKIKIDLNVVREKFSRVVI